VCEGLRSRYVDVSPGTTALTDAYRLRTHDNFIKSSDHGCSTCGFILGALRYFEPSSNDATSVLLRIHHTGGCEVFMNESCSTIQVYTPKGTLGLSRYSSNFNVSKRWPQDWTLEAAINADCLHRSSACLAWDHKRC
jgi:hypothetical protein